MADATPGTNGVTPDKPSKDQPGFFHRQWNNLVDSVTSVKNWVVDKFPGSKGLDTASEGGMGAVAGAFLDDNRTEGAMIGGLLGGALGYLGMSKGDAAKVVGIATAVDLMLNKFGGFSKQDSMLYGVLAAGAVALIGLDRMKNLFSFAGEKVQHGIDSLITPSPSAGKPAPVTPGM